MKAPKLKFYLTMAILLFVVIVNAQKNIKNQDLPLGSSVHVETNDGNDFIGILISNENNAVRVRTEKLGELTIQYDDIKVIEVTQKIQIHNGVYWYENPNASRYLFAPSAYNLRKGEGYYQNTWLFLNQVSYGFTDNFTCGLGVVPFFLFGAGEYSPFWITPKFKFGKGDRKFNFSTGAIAFFVPFGGSESSGTVGILYGLGTYGNRDNNLSVGLGLGFGRSDGEGYWGKRPTLNISGMYRLSKSSYMVSENWFAFFGDEDFVSNISLFSLAYRYAGKHVSIDLGLFNPFLFDGVAIGFPWLGVALPFGKKKAH